MSFVSFSGRNAGTVCDALFAEMLLIALFSLRRSFEIKFISLPDSGFLGVSDLSGSSRITNSVAAR